MTIQMESDMLVLRNLLNELKVVNDSVRDDEGNGIFYDILIYII